MAPLGAPSFDATTVGLGRIAAGIARRRAAGGLAVRALAVAAPLTVASASAESPGPSMPGGGHSDEASAVWRRWEHRPLTPVPPAWGPRWPSVRWVG